MIPSETPNIFFTYKHDFKMILFCKGAKNNNEYCLIFGVFFSDYAFKYPAMHKCDMNVYHVIRTL